MSSDVLCDSAVVDLDVHCYFSSRFPKKGDSIELEQVKMKMKKELSLQ